jgi:hypothetical protein
MMRMMDCPKSVKFERGTVKSPVTDKHEVAVKIRSNRGIGASRDIGRERRNVPTPIAARMEHRMSCSGGSKGPMRLLFMVIFL